MTKQPKILIAAPTGQKKEYCTFDWIDNIRKTNYPNFSILLVDNSPTLEFQKKIIKYGVECIHIDPIGTPAQYVARSQNIIRDRVLKGGYDYFYSVEIDNFPEPDDLSILLSYKAKTIALPYFLWFDDKRALGVQREVYNGYAAGEMASKALPFNRVDSFMQFDNGLKQYFAPALGTTLIHRDVLESIPFRASEKMHEGNIYSDSLFFLDCNKKGIKPLVLMKDIVEHRRSYSK